MNEPKEFEPKPHTCEQCEKRATACYREGRGTGHSEHVCACPEHAEEAQFWVPPHWRG